MKPCVDNNPCAEDFEEECLRKRRYSRRKVGQEPTEDLACVETPKLSREMRNLTTKGGSGGKLRKEYEESTNWEYFPTRGHGSFALEESMERNKNEFMDLTKNQGDEDIFDTIDETRQTNKSTYQLVNLQDLQVAINKICVTRSVVDTYLDEMSEICAIEDKFERTNHAISLKNKWIRYSASSEKIALSCKNMGLDAHITLQCTTTGNEAQTKQQFTRYEGTSYRGTPHKTENCSWYQTNLRLVLRTLAAGMGPSVISTICSFIGLPDLQSFSRQQFQRIESLIGKHLREVADSSMKRALYKEILSIKQFKKQHTDDNPTGLTV